MSLRYLQVRNRDVAERDLVDCLMGELDQLQPERVAARTGVLLQHVLCRQGRQQTMCAARRHLQGCGRFARADALDAFTQHPAQKLEGSGHRVTFGVRHKETSISNKRTPWPRVIRLSMQIRRCKGSDQVESASARPWNPPAAGRAFWL